MDSPLKPPAANPTDLDGARDWFCINLLAEDVAWMENAGRTRNAHGQARGMVSKTSTQADTWHIQGIMGEWATSLVYNVPISRITGNTRAELRSGDLGELIECKTTSYADPKKWALLENVGSLKQGRYYVLTLTCWWPRWLVVAGWCTAEEFDQLAYRPDTPARSGNMVMLLGLNKLRKPIEFFDVLRGKGPVTREVEAQVALPSVSLSMPPQPPKPLPKAETSDWTQPPSWFSEQWGSRARGPA